MSPRVARSLRALLNLPRCPRDMDPKQRLAYRSIKARYLALPSPARALFLSNVALLQSTMHVTEV